MTQSAQNTRQVPPQGGTDAEVATALNNVIKGKINSVGTVTLATGATTTTVNNALVSSTSAILLFPQTANAAAEFGNGTIYYKPSDITNKTSFVLTHANNANADRTFAYVILG